MAHRPETVGLARRGTASRRAAAPAQQGPAAGLLVDRGPGAQPWLWRTGPGLPAGRRVVRTLLGRPAPARGGRRPGAAHRQPRLADQAFGALVARVAAGAVRARGPWPGRDRGRRVA